MTCRRRLCDCHSVSVLHEMDGTAYRDFASGLLCMPRAAPSHPPDPRADGPKPRVAFMPQRVLAPRPHPHNRPPAKAPFGLASAGLHFTSTRELISKLKEGLPIRAFETLQAEMELPASTLASVTNIAQRTLTRRRKTGRLQTDESERLFRIASLFDRLSL